MNKIKQFLEIRDHENPRVAYAYMHMRTYTWAYVRS